MRSQSSIRQIEKKLDEETIDLEAKPIDLVPIAEEGAEAVSVADINFE